MMPLFSIVFEGALITTEFGSSTTVTVFGVNWKFFWIRPPEAVTVPDPEYGLMMRK
jgi:hypothetical protein